MRVLAVSEEYGIGAGSGIDPQIGNLLALGQGGCDSAVLVERRAIQGEVLTGLGQRIFGDDILRYGSGDP